jgi:hypothetical protein
MVSVRNRESSQVGTVVTVLEVVTVVTVLLPLPATFWHTLTTITIFTMMTTAKC